MISNITGRSIDPLTHIRQSIYDIITTPIGSRVMRRDYGSRLYELIDAGINQALFVQLYAATASALLRWEPRFRLQRVHASAIIDDVKAGRISIDIEGEYLVRTTANNEAVYQPVRMEGLIL